MTVAVANEKRPHDLRDILPVPCDTCAPTRGSVAVYVIEFDVMVGGEPEGQRWSVCPDCLPSCIDAVDVQHQGFTLPVLSKLPVAEFLAVSA